MKRNYQQPTTKVVKYQMQTQLLSGSGEPEETPAKAANDGELIRYDYEETTEQTWGE